MIPIIFAHGSAQFTLHILTGRSWGVELRKKVSGVNSDFTGVHKVVIYSDREHKNVKATIIEGAGLTRAGNVITFGQSDEENNFKTDTYYGEMSRVLDGSDNTERVLKFTLLTEKSL